MSQYSETVGSFIRTGNYPLEANYIFSSEQELKNFYSEDINNTLLHKGLFKIVSSGDLLILYWVVLIDGELLFKPLIFANSLEDFSNEIAGLVSDLNLEITDRKNNILEILGTSNKEEIQSDLNSILKLSIAVISLKEQVLREINTIKLIIGLEDIEDLDYGNLTLISAKLLEFFNAEGTLKDVFDLISENYSKCVNRDNNLLTELNLTQIGVGLDSSGMFSPDQETNYLKNATSVMNALKTLDNMIAAGRIVERAYYDTSTEKIVLVFKTGNTDTLTIEIPASDLIQEWTVYNDPNSAIELSRERVVNGTDKLSSDVKIDPSSLNLLTKTNGKLLVDGSNIAKKSEIPTKVSQLDNDSGFITEAYDDTELQNRVLALESIDHSKYLTEHLDISHLATKSEVNTISENLTELSNSVDELAAIGAELNVIDTIKVNNVTLPVEDKTVNLTIPTSVSDLEDSNNYITKDTLAWYEG